MDYGWNFSFLCFPGFLVNLLLDFWIYFNFFAWFKYFPCKTNNSLKNTEQSMQRKFPSPFVCPATKIWTARRKEIRNETITSVTKIKITEILGVKSINSALRTSNLMKIQKFELKFTQNGLNLKFPFKLIELPLTQIRNSRKSKKKKWKFFQVFSLIQFLSKITKINRRNRLN